MSSDSKMIPTLTHVINKLYKLQDKVVMYLTHGDKKNEKSSKIITNDEYLDTYNDLYQILQKNYNREVETKILEAYRDLITNYIKNIILPSIASNEGELLLDNMIIQWTNFKILVNWLKKILMWIDTNTLQNQKKKTSLVIIAYEILTLQIAPIIREKVFEEVYKLIVEARNHIQIPKLKLKLVIKIYLMLSHLHYEFGFNTETKEIILRYSKIQTDFYVTNFQDLLIKRMRQDYSIIIEDIIKQSKNEYMIRANDIFKTEEELASYFYPQSWQAIRNMLDHEIIANFITHILENEQCGLSSMIQNNQIATLSHLFELFQRGDPINSRLLSLAFKKCIEDIGLSILKDQADPIQFINKLIEFKKSIDNITQSAFNSALEYQHKRDDGFRIFLSKFEKFPLFLAIYSDYLLTKEFKGKNDFEIEDIVVWFIRIFSYLSYKDAFFKIYSKKLSKRLINNTTLSLDYEKDLIKRFSNDCGKASVTKLEIMLKDLNISDEHYQIYKTYHPDSLLKPLILTSGNWPMIEDIDNNILCPIELQKYQNEFEKFYFSQISSISKRKLKWLIRESKADLIMTTNTGKYNIEVKGYQVCILLQFNNHSSLTYSKLKTLTGMNDDILTENLKVLTSKSNSYPMILLRKNEKNSNEDNAFKLDEPLIFNENFKSEKKRIIIHNSRAMRSLLDTMDINQNEKDLQDLEKERGQLIDSYIVRIMKHRKIINFVNIEEEIIKLCTIFKPNIQLIKKRIEYLIEKDYIKRDEFRKIVKFLIIYRENDHYLEFCINRIMDGNLLQDSSGKKIWIGRVVMHY